MARASIGKNPHQRRDIICGLIFIPSATIVAGNIELHRFERGFWIALAIALLAWICTYRRWGPIIALLALAAIRGTVAFVFTQDRFMLLLGVISGALLLCILWVRGRED